MSPWGRRFLESLPITPDGYVWISDTDLFAQQIDDRYIGQGRIYSYLLQVLETSWWPS